MTIADTNAIIRAYLITQTALTAVVTGGIFCPRLPENATLPAISFFERSGEANPHIPGIIISSVQFDCWADNPIDAREVYGVLYDALQGKQNIATGSTQGIMSAIEEVQGQDLVDNEIQNYFRVLTFFRIMVRAE